MQFDVKIESTPTSCLHLYYVLGLKLDEKKGKLRVFGKEGVETGKHKHMDWVMHEDE